MIISSTEPRGNWTSVRRRIWVGWRSTVPAYAPISIPAWRRTAICIPARRKAFTIWNRSRLTEGRPEKGQAVRETCLLKTVVVQAGWYVSCVCVFSEVGFWIQPSNILSCENRREQKRSEWKDYLDKSDRATSFPIEILLPLYLSFNSIYFSDPTIRHTWIIQFAPNATEKRSQYLSCTTTLFIILHFPSNHSKESIPNHFFHIKYNHQNLSSHHSLPPFYDTVFLRKKIGSCWNTGFYNFVTTRSVGFNVGFNLDELPVGFSSVRFARALGRKKGKRGTLK